jgi:hypothetical protein
MQHRRERAKQVPIDLPICRMPLDGQDQLIVASGQCCIGRDYVEQDEKARAKGLDVPAYDCVPAWEWRRQALGR